MGIIGGLIPERTIIRGLLEYARDNNTHILILANQWHIAASFKTISRYVVEIDKKYLANPLFYSSI